MKLQCPACGAAASAEIWESEVHRRKVLAIRDSLPPQVASQFFTYHAFFRAPDSVRGLGWPRLARLAEALSALVSAGHVQRGSDPARPAPPGIWAEAIGRIIDRPPKRLPLKDHNYLAAIAYDLADAMDRQNEIKRNRAEREGQPPSRPEVERVPIDELRKIREERFPGRRSKVARKAGVGGPTMGDGCGRSGADDPPTERSGGDDGDGGGADGGVSKIADVLGSLGVGGRGDLSSGDGGAG